MDTTKCKDCTYDEHGRLTHTSGPCEEEAIKARIKWWQDGKRKLKEKEGEVTCTYHTKRELSFLMLTMP